MSNVIDKVRKWFGGRSAAPEDLSHHPDDDDPGATTGLDRPFPEAPPPPSSD